MTGFGDVQALASLFAGYARPWFISGGWAIDLFVGRVTREHEDLEVGIFRGDQQTARELLATWTLEKVVQGPEGAKLAAWDEGEWLELPVHQIKAHSASLKPAAFDVFLNDLVGEKWRFRRNPAITRPRTQVVLRSAGGIPFMAPEVQLLYKARYHRPKDEHDFGVVHDRLSATQRAWLREALAVFLADDPWLAGL